MAIVNLTPHLVRIMDKDGNLHEIQPSGTVATVSVVMRREPDLSVDGVTFNVSSRDYGHVQGLPNRTPGTVFIVSAMVKDRTPVRFDVFAPDTGPSAIRKDGQVWAVHGLVGYN